MMDGTTEIRQRGVVEILLYLYHSLELFQGYVGLGKTVNLKLSQLLVNHKIEIVQLSSNAQKVKCSINPFTSQQYPDF